jgi:hypothetical protein
MLVVAIALGCCVVMPMPGFVIQSVRDIATGRTEPDQYEVAHELSTMGIGAGDRIASIGSPFESIFFARLGKLKFVAQVMDDDVGLFWGLDKQSMAEVFRSLATTGARAVIAKDVPGPERSDWNRLGNSGFYVHFLNETPPRKHP